MFAIFVKTFSYKMATSKVYCCFFVCYNNHIIIWIGQEESWKTQDYSCAIYFVIWIFFGDFAQNVCKLALYQGTCSLLD